MEKETTYYIGIDWGKTTIGLALSDSEMRIASALKEIPASEIGQELMALSRKYKLEKVVVGMTKMAEPYGHINKRHIKALADFLQQKGIAVEFEEEQFTTRLAQQNLAQVKDKAISRQDNAEAARIILQSWLDRQAG